MPLDIDQIMMKLSNDVAAINQSIADIRNDIAEIKGDSRIDDLKEKIHCVEEEVNKLKNFKYWFMGACAVISLIVSYLVSKA